MQQEGYGFLIVAKTTFKKFFVTLSFLEIPTKFLGSFLSFPTVWAMSEYEVLSGWYFQQEKSLNSRTLHAVSESTLELLT